MKTRMQPIGNVWSKFPRVVRDLAVACGKQVRFEMEGRETELDKTIIETIRDPLTHIVRNAVDHGIEPPEVRTPAASRPRAGCAARLPRGRQGHHRDRDDGAASTRAVRDKAVQLELVTADQAARMSDGTA